MLTDDQIVNLMDTLPLAPPIEGVALLHFLAGCIHTFYSECVGEDEYGWRHSCSGDIFIMRVHDDLGL